MASTWLVFTFGVSFTMDVILFTLETLILILILTNNSQSSSWSIAWMGVALYGAYAVDVTLDSSALKDAVVDCSTTWDGSEFQSPTVRDALIIRNESFIFIMDSRFTVKTRQCVPPLTKTMLMHKIATSCWIPTQQEAMDRFHAAVGCHYRTAGGSERWTAYRRGRSAATGPVTPVRRRQTS